MRTVRFILRNIVPGVLVLDLVVLLVLWWAIPGLDRPSDLFLLAGVVLGILTAAVMRNAVARTLCVIAASLALTVFAAETAQGMTNFLNLFDKPSEAAFGSGGPYAWNAADAAGYVSARRRALADGEPADILSGRLAGDIFAGADRTGLYVERSDKNGAVAYTEALKPPLAEGPPLGAELTPANRIRRYAYEKSGGETLFDAECSIGADGNRAGGDAPSGADAFLFFGDDYVFGGGLNDDETLPYRFSEAGGFAAAAYNFGLPGSAPNQVLRDLDLDYRPGRAGVDPAAVKGVIYVLTDGQAGRMTRPEYPASPYYRIRDGKPVFQGRFREEGYGGRWRRVLDRSRLYPVLEERIGAGLNPFDAHHKWDLTLAALASIHDLSVKRYGVPLTVLYWGGDREVILRLGMLGLTCVAVGEIFGDDWELRAIRYRLVDGRPSAYANKLLGDFMYDRMMREF